GREQARLPARLRRDRVRIVEPGGLGQRLEDIQVLVRVYPFERDAGGRRYFACVGKRLQQHGQPFSGFRMPEGRMKLCECRMRQDVDSAATRSASALSPSSRTKTDASAHFGV